MTVRTHGDFIWLTGWLRVVAANSFERVISDLVPSQVKPLIYQIDTCHFLAWHSALVG